MSPVNAVSAPSVPVTIAASEPQSGAQTGSSGGVRNAGGSPAVIVTIRSESAQPVPATSKLPTLDPGAVDQALALVGGANGSADIAAHFAYAAVEAKFGKAIADRNQSVVNGAVFGGVSRALSYAKDAGIPVQQTVDIGAIKPGVTTNPFAVATFSFTNAGSVCTVTPDGHGMLIGTKDGQGWRQWQLTELSRSANSDKTTETTAKSLSDLTARIAEINKVNSSVDRSA